MGALRSLRRRHGSSTWVDPPLPVPEGQTLEGMRELVASIRVDGAPAAELDGYWREAFGRFLRTLDLTKGLGGRGLELGANPYFLTVLLQEFSDLDLTLANYFGQDDVDEAVQRVSYRNGDGAQEREMRSRIFNAEGSRFPFADGSFEVVLFCEIVEHMTDDPLATLREINRVLAPGGCMIITTPNVARLENLARMILGENLYDPYSGYGPHGRHNREYNCHELALLLRYAGFSVEEMSTGDSHPSPPDRVALTSRIEGIGPARALDLGQYIFARAVKVGPGRALRPSFLYRSYPAGQIEPFG